jgi:hypothetical protein
MLQSIRSVCFAGGIDDRVHHHKQPNTGRTGAMDNLHGRPGYPPQIPEQAPFTQEEDRAQFQKEHCVCPKVSGLCGLREGTMTEYCFICGKELSIKYHISKYRTTCICGDNPECIQKYKTYRAEGRRLYYGDGELFKVDGFCRLCGRPHKLRYTRDGAEYAHNQCSRENNLRRIALIEKKYPPPASPPPLPNYTPKPRTYLKPWQDPESLFCDTKFLKQLLGKEPAKGEECKDVRRAHGRT